MYFCIFTFFLNFCIKAFKQIKSKRFKYQYNKLVIKMDEQHHKGGEIVIRITPKNLERIVYILIIIGLIVTSIIGFTRTSPDCPEVECEEEPIDDITAGTVTDTTDNTDTTDTTEETTDDTTTITLSGEVEFLITDVKLCMTNETGDKGQFESISIYIKNGKERAIKTRLDLYLWDSNDDEALKLYPSTKVDKINVLSGGTLTRQYTVEAGHFSNRGMFTENEKDKTVKAILIDTELNKKLETITKTNIETTINC